MEKERGTKIMSVAALIIGVVALSFGFAAFTKDLTITSVAGTVQQSNSLNVAFVESSVTPSVTSGDTTAVSGTTATVSGTSLTGVSATFQKKGDKVQYVFTIKNNGTYDAYLNAITFSQSPTCTGKTGEGVNAPSVDVAAICSDLVKMTISVENADNDIETTSTTVNNISEHVVKPSGVETVTLVLEYVGNKEADGDFTVNFGTVTLSYGSVDA